LGRGRDRLDAVAEQVERVGGAPADGVFVVRERLTGQQRLAAP
jgi:hypothetical protein